MSIQQLTEHINQLSEIIAQKEQVILYLLAGLVTLAVITTIIFINSKLTEDQLKDSEKDLAAADEKIEAMRKNIAETRTQLAQLRYKEQQP